MQMLTVLGSTGSIGVNTLDVVRRWKGRYAIHSLVAGNNVGLLAKQIVEFRPQLAVVADAAGREALAGELKGHGMAASEWPQLEIGRAHV